MADLTGGIAPYVLATPSAEDGGWPGHEVGGGGVPVYFKMRAQDSGAAPPGYVTWVVTGSPDFAGAGYAGGSPAPIGPMVVGSAVVAARWEG